MNINEIRNTLFEVSHNFNNEPSITSKEQIFCWMGHKAISVISFPVNVLDIAVSATLGAASLCTIGALKIAVFALTLGNVKLPISTHFTDCAFRVFNATYGCFQNIGELLYDATDLVYQSRRIGKYLIEKLHLEGILKKISEKINQIFVACINKLLESILFCWTRVNYGFNKAFIDELSASELKLLNFPRLSMLNEATKLQRIDLKEENRFISTIFKHTLYSLANIPSQLAIAVISTAASFVLTAAFISKSTIYTITEVSIPYPTYVLDANSILFQSLFNVIFDTGTILADVVVLAYKTMDTLKVTKAASTVLGVILYIPQALLER